MKTIKLALAALAVLTMSAASAPAQTLLYSGTATSTPTSGVGSVTVGLAFTVGSTAINVTSLGIWDYDQEGLLSAHEIGLWNSSGTLVAEATVGSGTSGTLVTDGVNGFRFATVLDNGSDVAVSSVTLAANTTYHLGELLTSSNDPYLANFQTSSITFASDTATTATGSTPGAFYNGSAGLNDPTTAAGNGNKAYAGPNLEFSVVEVPEPSASALILLGVGGLAAACIRRQNRQRLNA